jgi:hypothetical protein
MGSKELSLQEKTNQKEKNLIFGKVSNLEAKNPFLQACLENIAKNIPKKAGKCSRLSP